MDRGPDSEADRTRMSWSNLKRTGVILHEKIGTTAEGSCCRLPAVGGSGSKSLEHSGSFVDDCRLSSEELKVGLPLSRNRL